MRRLILMQRLGLLAPMLRMHRWIEERSAPQRRVSGPSPAASLRIAGRTD
jgi:hypothetical protein